MISKLSELDQCIIINCFLKGDVVDFNKSSGEDESESNNFNYRFLRGLANHFERKYIQKWRADYN